MKHIYGVENAFGGSDYFDEIEPGTTRFCRIDNLQPSEHILECCKEA